MQVDGVIRDVGHIAALKFLIRALKSCQEMSSSFLQDGKQLDNITDKLIDLSETKLVESCRQNPP